MNTKKNGGKMKKPTLTQIRTAVRQGKANKVFRLYRKFTGDYTGINPIKEGCTDVQLERVCTNGLILKFIGKTMKINMPLYLYPYKKFVRRYVITKSMKSK